MAQQLFNKQQQRQAKLEAIIETAATLISARGVEGTSLDDVAAELGITKPTLYHYFESREDLLMRCLMRLLDQKAEALETAGKQGVNGKEKLEIFFKAYARFAWGPTSAVPSILVTHEISPKNRVKFNQANMKLVKQTRAFIKEGVDDGSLKLDRPELFEPFILSTVVWGSMSFLQREEPMDVEQVIAAYWTYLMDGVATS